MPSNVIRRVKNLRQYALELPISFRFIYDLLRFVQVIIVRLSYYYHECQR